MYQIALVSRVRVYAGSVGVIKTPMYGPEPYEAIATLHPIGRAGEISNIVDRLDLERATFVTGETLHIDGGQAAGIESGPSG
jgi:NAD(P)-dependent dehydrogenase (short-subunit alcohol dehydrogenase family)